MPGQGTFAVSDGAALPVFSTKKVILWQVKGYAYDVHSTKGDMHYLEHGESICPGTTVLTS